jgi:hypothetical protein
VKAQHVRFRRSIDRSLVVTDSALDKGKFSFLRTIGSILTSMNIDDTAEKREAFIKTLLTSFNYDVQVNPISGLRMRIDQRSVEAGLDPKKLLDPGDPTGLVPVALFNRLDLAPADWSNCGEYRIVYSFKAPIPVTPTAPTPTSRFFLIFEARTPNATVRGTGFEGCRATANFWRSLTGVNEAKERAIRLEKFYFTGSAGTAGRVVQAKNYGGPLGQVRGNLFLNTRDGPFKWQLREWIVINSGQPTPASFVSVTVKDNPLAEFYAAANATGLDASLDPILETSERFEFQKEFLNSSLTRLIAPDVIRNFLTSGQPGYKPELDPKSARFDQKKYKIEILNTFGGRSGNRFNEFQSVAQGSEDNPEAKAGRGSIFRERIADKLGEFVIDPMQKPAAKHILNRAGALTCGGCHQFTTEQPIGRIQGQLIVWPKSADMTGFVHVTESGNLSSALSDVFLPFRQDRFGEAVCIEADGATAETVLDNARQRGWEGLLAAARAQKDEALQRAITLEAIQAIMLQRQEEVQKPGYFVTDRRAH